VRSDADVRFGYCNDVHNDDDDDDDDDDIGDNNTCTESWWLRTLGVVG